MENKNGMSYPKESILTDVTAYEFLRRLRATSVQKFCLEISYKDYAHGKIILTSEDFEVGGDKSIVTFFKKTIGTKSSPTFEYIYLNTYPELLINDRQSSYDNDIIIIKGD